jgi:hypothetical protein
MGWILKAVPVAALVLVIGHFSRPRFQIPPHLLNHPAVECGDLLSGGIGSRLVALLKEMGHVPSNAEDTRFYKPLHEHAGDLQPLNANGTCSHKYQIPNRDRTGCILANRIDIARHYALHGGTEGNKEDYDTMVSRLQSFGRYMFNVSEYPVVQELFESRQFQDAARVVCPANKQVLDPIQFNFIVQLPGQTVATHVDGQYFYGASRFQVPMWLLAVMVFSNLFQDRFIDQVQVVGYLHEWQPSEERASDFVYWNTEDGKASAMKPTPFTGNAIDGSKTVHAAKVYYPSRTPPMLDKGRVNSLNYLGDDKWEVRADGEVVATYDTDELRMSLVYRARCFESQAHVEEYHRTRDDPATFIPLEEILALLKADLVKRGAVRSIEVANAMAPLDLNLLLMDEYIRYPLPADAWIPYNYCMLGKLWPAVQPIMKWLC